METRLLFICLLVSAFAVSVKGKPHVKHQASFKSSHTTTEKITQHAVSEGANKDQVLHTNVEASSLEQEDEELSSQDNVDKEEEREEGDEDGKRSTPVLLSEEELVNLLQESREEVKEEVKEEVEEEVEEEEGKVEVESAETVEEVPAKHEAEVEGEMAEEGEEEEGVDVKEGEVMREKEEETDKRAQEEAEDSEEEEEDIEKEEEAADKQNDKKEEESLAVDREQEADVKDIGSSTETEIPSDMDYTMPLETQTPARKTPADETLPLLEEKELDEAKSSEQKEEEAEGEIPTAVNDYESQQDVKNTESLEDKELSDQGKPQEVNQNSGQDSQAKPQENSSTREEDKPEVDQGSNNSMELDGSMEEDKKKESISHPKGKIRKMKKNLRVRKHHAQRDEASHDSQRDEASHDSQRDEASHDFQRAEASHDSQRDEAPAGQASQDSKMDEVHAGKASQDSKMDEVHAGKASQDFKMDEVHAGQASQDSQMDEAPAGQASQNSQMDEAHAGQASQDSQMDEAPAGQASQDSQMDKAHAGQASQDSQMDEAPAGQASQDSQMDEAPAGQHHQDSEKSEGQVEPSLPTDNAFHKPQRKRAGKWAPSVGMNPVQVRARVDLYPRTRPLLWTSNHRGEASTDPCDTFHCKRGKTCMLDKDNKPTCVCQQPSACPHSKSEIDHVCGSDNVTYDTSCELFATKCNLEGTRRGHKLHLDYTGPCKLIAPCLSLELVQFPLRMRDWLKNVLLQLYEHDSKTPGFLTSKQRIRVRKIFESERRLHAGDHPIELLAQDFEKNYNMYIYPVHWQFAQMDQHPADRLLTHSELAPLRVPLVPMEHCTSLFFQECDVDKDKKVSFREWAHCFGIKNEDMDVNLLF